MDKKLIEALKDPAHYGWSVHEVAMAVDVYVPTTALPAKEFRPDPKPLTISKEDHHMLLALGYGLTKIFNADRERLNDPGRWDPKEYERQSRSLEGQT